MFIYSLTSPSTRVKTAVLINSDQKLPTDLRSISSLASSSFHSERKCSCCTTWAIKSRGRERSDCFTGPLLLCCRPLHYTHLHLTPDLTQHLFLSLSHTHTPPLVSHGCIAHLTCCMCATFTLCKGKREREGKKKLEAAWSRSLFLGDDQK